MDSRFNNDEIVETKSIWSSDSEKSKDKEPTLGENYRNSNSDVQFRYFGFSSVESKRRKLLRRPCLDDVVLRLNRNLKARRRFPRLTRKSCIVVSFFFLSISSLFHATARGIATVAASDSAVSLSLTVAGFRICHMKHGSPS